MKHYKAPDNSLHFIEPEFAYMLPPGSVEITDEEAEAIRKANTPPAPNPRITEIKAELAANDAKIIRALAEGDLARIAAHNAEQDLLRQELRTLG